MTGKLVIKTQRKLDCGTCTGCTTSTDCGKCKMCLDKPKFGGLGKQKQRCIMRKCQNHPTKPPMKISTNKSPSLEVQFQTSTCMSSKLYKCFVYKTNESYYFSLSTACSTHSSRHSKKETLPMLTREQIEIVY